MEPEIHSTLPGGSPLLAYGQTQRSRKNIILVWVLGSVFGLCAIFFGWLLLFATMVLPEHIVSLAIVSGNSDTPAFFPEIWRDAVASVRHPVMLGLAREGDVIEPFVVGLRFDRLSAPGITRGAFSLQAENGIVETTIQPFRHLVLRVFGLLWHDAFLTVDPRGLNVERIDTANISGYIDQGIWHTDARLAEYSTHDPLPVGDVMLDVKNLPEAWPLMREALAHSSMPVELDESPESLGWVEGAGAPRLELHFSEHPTTSTLLALAAASGLYDGAVYTLPDGVIVDELRAPSEYLQILNANSSSRIQTGNFDFLDKTVALGQLQVSTTVALSCQTENPALLHLQGNSFSLLKEAVGLSFFKDLSALTILLGRDQVVEVCVR